METAFILLTIAVLLEAIALMVTASTLDKSESIDAMDWVVNTSPTERTVMQTGYICGTVYTVIHGYVLFVP